ncbi:type I-E CRISPR-associated protein Cas5/CasD [Levilactobacillus tangyuanensis]|uniref:Type I-E CRISPR-associated protein Cas5/CasD n=1 Tax=Levilactobacillus tangyuanensis TaxID=2486021 RepID=A0ABW1TLT5_9LACO|nr:type I-E CRISPR-associated protein Cas5/CasD [Levilactobacillus tangyuanensis]
MKTLTIKLTGPLQSYGNEASFERRTTNNYPTKSAVIGMISAALGYRRTDERILTLNDLDFAVRLDQVGRVITDYQTVEWHTGTRKITYRDYIQDAVFVVALGSQDEELIEKIEFALHHPKFQLFLGRRSNVPAGVLKTQVFGNMTVIDALKKLNWQATLRYRRKSHEQALEIMADANLVGDSLGVAVKDRVVSFSQRDRRHGFRAVARTRVNLSDLDSHEVEPETNHDIMGFL